MSEARLQASAQVLLFACVSVALLIFSPESLFFFIASLFIVLVFGKLFRFSPLSDVATVFLGYSAGAVLLFLLQLYLLPAFHGMSGPEGGYGTDDGYYFSLASPILPHDFPTRPGFYQMSSPYAAIFAPISQFAYAAFGKINVLDLVMPNLIFLTIIPFATRDLANQLSDRATAQRAFWLCAFGPFLLANGLILVRDAWVASFLVLASLLALQRRYWMTLFVVALALYVRIGTGLLTIFGAAVFIALHVEPHDGGLRISFGRRTLYFSVVYFVVAAAALGATVVLVGSDTIFALIDRAGFITGFLRQEVAGDSGTSTLYSIATLPWPLSLPLGTLFFFGSPFLDLRNVIFSGTATGFVLHSVFNPRAAMSSLFAILFIIYVGWFFRGIMRGMRAHNVGVIILAIILLVDLAAIAQFSLVLRHKVSIQPLFYVLTAYGIGHTTSDARIIGYIGGLGVLLLNLYVNAHNLRLF